MTQLFMYLAVVQLSSVALSLVPLARSRAVWASRIHSETSSLTTWYPYGLAVLAVNAVVSAVCMVWLTAGHPDLLPMALSLFLPGTGIAGLRLWFELPFVRAQLATRQMR